MRLGDPFSFKLQLGQLSETISVHQEIASLMSSHVEIYFFSVDYKSFSLLRSKRYNLSYLDFLLNASILNFFTLVQFQYYRIFPIQKHKF